MGARRNPIGTRLGTHKDKTKTRMIHRSKDKRVQSGMEKARESNRKLDARIASELAAEQEIQRTAPDVALPTVVVSKPIPAPRRARPAPSQLALDPWRKGTTVWTLGEARQQVTDGYSLARVVKRTGWGEAWFNDLHDVRP